MTKMRASTDIPTLYIVATPIGNLDDITFRALKILQSADLIAAEDTRHSARLLQHYQITTNMIAYHDHSDDRQVQFLIDKILAGESLALICDAGTPLISDPGYALVKRARELSVPVVPIPGSCALIAALSASGLSSYQFSFEGFAPAKSVARQKAFIDRVKDTRTLIYYESPHRIEACLSDMREALGGDRVIVLARELTKTFETFLSGTIDEVIKRVALDSNQRKGEMVLLVSGFQQPEAGEHLSAEHESIMRVLLDELPLKQAAAIGAKITGGKKNKLYQWALNNFPK